MRGEADVVEQIRVIASRVAASQGLEIFDVQFRREALGMVLRILVDRPEPPEAGVSVEDCASLGRELSAILDVEDVVQTAYTLEVSSPGLDRPLRTARDYVRFAGRHARIVTREKVDNQNFFKGTLAGVEDDNVLIDAEDRKRHRLPIGLITRANLEVEF